LEINNMREKKNCEITEKLVKHFRKIREETGIPVSMQITMYLKGYIIKKCST